MPHSLALHASAISRILCLTICSALLSCGFCDVITIGTDPYTDVNLSSGLDGHGANGVNGANSSSLSQAGGPGGRGADGTSYIVIGRYITINGSFNLKGGNGGYGGGGFSASTSTGGQSTGGGAGGDGGKAGSILFCGTVINNGASFNLDGGSGGAGGPGGNYLEYRT
jgi:hypothetical protein